VKTTIDGITRLRFMMGWTKPESILKEKSFIEVDEQEFENFISEINYRRISYSDCTIYCDARGFGQDHLAYHYDNGWNPHRFLIKQ